MTVRPRSTQAMPGVRTCLDRPVRRSKRQVSWAASWRSSWLTGVLPSAFRKWERALHSLVVNAATDEDFWQFPPHFERALADTLPEGFSLKVCRDPLELAKLVRAS